MASSHFTIFTRANLHNYLLYPPQHNNGFFHHHHHHHHHHLVVPVALLHPQQQQQLRGGEKNRGTQRTSRRGFSGIRVSNGDSYLDMWKEAVDRERKELEFQKIAENSSKVVDDDVNGNGKGVGDDDNPEVLERKSDEFKKILEVPKEERDRIQRMQVIDRAAAALAAAQALLKETPPLNKASSSADDSGSGLDSTEINGESENQKEEGIQGGKIFVNPTGNSGIGTPGPNFWSWTPPVDDGNTTSDVNPQIAGKPTSSPSPSYPVIEKERLVDSLSIPFQSTVSEKHNPPLPPLQSLMDVADVKPKMETPTAEEEHQHEVQFSANAAEAAEALNKVEESSPSSEGVNPDGSKWWKETGIEQRPGGVVYKWTLMRGVSADKSMEWEDKFWEATGDFEFKELGSEKSGRDASGNVWREYWKESMWKDYNTGLVHMEKNADKWGKNGMGGQWHEKWWEHYDASGQAEKWADKWCSIDPNTPLEPGHAHVWHERWGEKYDGQGASIKYTDKWAERSEGDGWAKWGDKWDENFNQYGQGVKQGESWWQGKYGDRWNRTWGEGHNGSGWIHKYGKSSSGEHWDTHVQQDTWYERYPHFGFDHCFENSVQLREVRKPPETS